MSERARWKPFSSSCLILTHVKQVWLTTGITHTRLKSWLKQALNQGHVTQTLRICKMVVNSLHSIKVVMSIKRDNKRNLSSACPHPHPSSLHH